MRTGVLLLGLLLFLSGVTVGFVLTGSWLPVLFGVLPRFYGAPFIWVFIWLQHVGLAENVWDHRLSTRSLRVNFFFTFLFMNMESHIEHHLYPMVPFHALPRLRRGSLRSTPRSGASASA